jgi:hypothetical protein
MRRAFELVKGTQTQGLEWGEGYHGLARALQLVERCDEMETGVVSLERGQTTARERLETRWGRWIRPPRSRKTGPAKQPQTIP